MKKTRRTGLPLKEFRGKGLHWEWRDGVVELTLDHEPLNEMGTLLLGELEQFVAAIDGLAPITSACIITSARPGGFSVGGDLKELYNNALNLPPKKRVAGFRTFIHPHHPRAKHHEAPA